MDRKKLAAKILEVIERQQPIKASKITRFISAETGEFYTKKDINSVIYSELRTKLSQDEQYRWSVIGANVGLKGSKTTAKLPPKDLPKTLLNKLVTYYSECISFERDTEVSVYSTSKYDKSNYIQLSSLPEISNNFEKHWEQDDVRQKLASIKRGQRNQKLYLGYPVFVRPTPKGAYIKLEPLFLFAFDIESAGVGNYPSLSEESPRINLSAFKGYAEESGNLFDDLVQLQHELGLDQDVEDLPRIDELVLNLKSLRPLWPWKGELDPQNINEIKLAEVSAAGLYNTAILVKGEGSKFTKGLEKELGLLKSIPSDNDYRSSVLSGMLGLSEMSTTDHDLDIVEAVQLNYEQKRAIQSVFNNKLTVITGPPGTGKSQVVTGILINAAKEGWKVLFSSKNNKAVDVVEHRVNALSHQPFVLRLGAKDLQKSLAEKLTYLISSQQTTTSQNNYKRLDDKHVYLSKELKEIFGLMEQVVELRNQIDALDQSLEREKRKLPDVFFNKDNKSLLLEIHNFQARLQKLSLRKKNAKNSRMSQVRWALYSWINSSKINKLIESMQEFLIRYSITDSRYKNNTLEGLSEIAIELKKIVEESIQYWDLRKKIKHLHSFEELCRSYNEIHSALVEVDEDLWKSWLSLTTDRMTVTQRVTLGQYISTLKYIVEASTSGETINKKTWRDYYRLTEEVSPLLPVWAVTSLSANGRLPLEPGVFDLVVIDEASQCDIASVIPLLYRAKRAVVLGDPNQLRHITTLSGRQDLQLLEKHDLNDFMIWGYAKNSCFDLAVSTSENVITLREHHRSHQDIIQFSNQVYYGGALRVATKTEKLKSLKSKNDTNVEWVSVSGKVERFRGSGACNREEARAVFDYVEDLVKIRSYEGTIGIVTPFRGQANIINELFAKSEDLTKHLANAELLIDTVHKFQGDERDIIIFSPVVSHGIYDSALGFLRSQGNLFNVAITRARSHLAVIGDQAVCKSSDVSYLAKFVDYVESLSASHSIENLAENDLDLNYPKAVYDPRTVSDWEVRFYKAMYKAGIRAIPQYKEDKYRLDFAIFDGQQKLNIEIDGEKYHKDWDGNLILEDQVRNDRLRELGWFVKRFWVFEVRDEEGRCIQEILEWLESTKMNSA